MPDSRDLGTVRRVCLGTECGDIVIEVYPDRAPQSVAGFLRYVDENRFVGAKFIRSVRHENDLGSPPITVIQSAVSENNIPHLRIQHENTEFSGIHHADGVVSLARGAPGTATPGHFFICIGDQPSLDYNGLRNKDGLGFAAFGRVIKGMDVVLAIHQGPTAAEAPDEFVRGQLLASPVQIHTVRRLD